MSLNGPKQTFCDCGLESAFGGKADIVPSCSRAADRGEYCQAAGAFAEAVIRSVELIVQPDAHDESCRSWKK
jgi:hypothetical protein